jgi:hypothetical protein
MISEMGLHEMKKIHTQEEKQLAAQSISNQMGMMASILAGQSKFKAAYKALAIGQAFIDMYSSAQGAYKSAVSTPIVGPVIAPIAAGTAIAFGLKNISQISKYETGTAYASGGLTLVGEGGKEYVNLPRGSQVYNNTQTRNMTNNQTMTVNIVDNAGNITETMRREIRSGAGDRFVDELMARAARRL